MVTGPFFGAGVDFLKAVGRSLISAGTFCNDDRRHLYVEGGCGACLVHVVSRRRNGRRLQQRQNCLLASEDDVEEGVRHRADSRGCTRDDPQHPLTTRPSIALSTRLLQNMR